jgi:hypothetical protein
MFRRFSICTAFVVALVGCGGGGDGDYVPEPSLPADGVARFFVNKDLLLRQVSSERSIGGVQNSTSGYMDFPSSLNEWSGLNLRYSQGYSNPTAGTLRTYRMTAKSDGASWSMSGVSFDIAKSPPSLTSDEMPFTAILTADSVIISGGFNNDYAIYFPNAQSIDLGEGSDTLRFFDNFSNFEFEKSIQDPGLVRIKAKNGYTEVRNVEFFEFSSAGGLTENISLAALLQRIAN